MKRGVRRIFRELATSSLILLGTFVVVVILAAILLSIDFGLHIVAGKMP